MKYVTPLHAAEIHTLHEMHRSHLSRRARMCAPSLLLSHQGVSMPHIARTYQVNRRSVSGWVDRWHTLGLERMKIINLQLHAILAVGNG